MKRFFLHIIVAILLLSTSCEEIYVPELDQMPKSLVVEAILSNKQEPMSVKISRTIPFKERIYLHGEKKALVSIKTTTNKSYAFTEVSSGIYKSDLIIPLEQGVGYYLDIVTNDEEHYQSGIEEIVGDCDIADVQFANNLNKEINYDYYGDPYVSTFLGVEVSVLPDEPVNKEVGYLYRWKSLINYKVYSTAMPYEFNYYCWKKLNSLSIYVYDYNEKSQGNKLILDNLHFLAYKTLDPVIEDSTQFEGTIEKAYANSFYYYIEQYTIPKTAAKFWKSVKKQSEATGKLFDPVNEEVESNIKCISNPDLRCFGNFSTAAYANQILVVSIDNYDVDHFLRVDNFPAPKKDEMCILGEPSDFWY